MLWRFCKKYTVNISNNLCSHIISYRHDFMKINTNKLPVFKYLFDLKFGYKNLGTVWLLLVFSVNLYVFRYLIFDYLKPYLHTARNNTVESISFRFSGQYCFVDIHIILLLIISRKYKVSKTAVIVFSCLWIISIAASDRFPSRTSWKYCNST